MFSVDKPVLSLGRRMRAGAMGGGMMGMVGAGAFAQVSDAPETTTREERNAPQAGGRLERQNSARSAFLQELD